jgi:hypothetical protein
MLFFLAQIRAMEQELRDRDAAAANPSQLNDQIERIERPDNVSNLRTAMRLGDDPSTYFQFGVSVFFRVRHTVTELHCRRLLDN